MFGAWDYRDGAGNCPPGYYRPAPGYDCRPNVPPPAPAILDAVTHYAVANPPATSSAATPAQQPYTPPVFSMPGAAAATSSGGGLDLTTLLLIGVALFFVMKKR